MIAYSSNSMLNLYIRSFWNLLVIMGLVISAIIVPVIQNVEIPSGVNYISESPSKSESLPEDVPVDWWGTVQENLQNSEYHVTWQDETYLPHLPAAYQAPNRAHNLRTYFTPDGIRVIPRLLSEGTEGEQMDSNVPWEWGMTLTGFGYADWILSVPDAELIPADNRVEYRRGTITEWYINDERGLEQGFTLASPPQTEFSDLPNEIILELSLTGDLTPHLIENGTELEFTTTGGVRVLHYGGLVTYDANGMELPSHLELILSEQDVVARVRIVVNAASAH